MKTYDVTCPVCGCVNHNLYLEETNGWMECEKCQRITKSCGRKYWGQIQPIPMHSNTNKVSPAPRVQ
jgi:hypothetical protein